ncbi:MAG: hypothetical protein KJ072_17785 [Verrucomicrobia bacterium]|nr:hypothetical protein [Verrucomicrobiota bacterium]
MTATIGSRRLVLVGSSLTLRQVLLAPLRFRLSASPSFVVVSRITLLGERHRKIPNARIKDVVLQGETLVIITDRRRIELGIKARNRTLYRDLPEERQLEIRSGRSTFPSSADAQFVYDTLRHGLIPSQPASDRS